MADSAELAFNEVANEIDLTNEISFKIQRADTTCNNTNKAKNAAKKLIEEGVDAIIGAACPEITKKIAEEIFIPKKKKNKKKVLYLNKLILKVIPIQL